MCVARNVAKGRLPDDPNTSTVQRNCDTPLLCVRARQRQTHDEASIDDVLDFPPCGTVLSRSKQPIESTHEKNTPAFGLFDSIDALEVRHSKGRFVRLSVT